MLLGARSRQKGPLAASFQLWAAHWGNLCLSEPWAKQMPDTTSLTGHPHSSAPRPSGCRQACASASAGPGMPCRGRSCCQGQWSHIYPWGQSSKKDKLQHHTPLGAGGELIQPSIRPRGGWMWPQSWGLRRFNARPCQMAQDQRFNLLPPSQLPHPNLSPAAPGS